MTQEFGWSAFDDEQVKMESMGFHHPLVSAIAFVNALEDPDVNAAALAALVTPESRDSWGNFSQAKEAYDSIDRPGFGSTVNRPPGAPDVGYFKVLSGVTEGYEVTEEALVVVPAVLTLIWRPEAEAPDGLGMWLVHQFGLAGEPNRLGHARTSPGEAPQF